MQGRLRGEYLSVEVETACGHCGQPMRIAVDSGMRVSVHDEVARPLVFLPDIDWKTFSEPNIIDAY
ncbi:MAG: hypothetical protein ACE5HA_15100 [Anaerolineae bacterium]